MADPLEDLRRQARELCAHEPASFSLETLHEAGRLAQDDPAALTDRHLQHIAVYEPTRILGLLQKRAVAVQRREATEAAGWDAYNAAFRAAHGVQTGAAQPLTAKSAPPVLAAVDELADTLLDTIEAAVTARTAALEQRVTDLQQQLTDVRIELDADRAVRR